MESRISRNAAWFSRASAGVVHTLARVKFHLSRGEGNVVTGCGPGWVRVGADEYRASLILTPETIVTPWAATFEALAAEHFERVRELEPAIVLLGTGVRQRFPHPRLYQALLAGGIGVEVMDSSAAARTYNIIAAEGRRVAAALILP
jgi:uncharacterized protein